LGGSKEEGTDAHTALARAMLPDVYENIVWDPELGVCEVVQKDETLSEERVVHFRNGTWITPVSKEVSSRLGKARDLGKIVGFTLLYGGSAKTVQVYIRKLYPEKSECEVAKFASNALKSKKGVLKNGYYTGGTDSGCFNFMEEIALKHEVSSLPCLGTKISTAMRKAYVDSDFRTGRVNWTIQSSGAEILSIILTSTHWLASEFKIPCRFVISIHDEVWFITPEKYAEQFSVLFQIAHLYTWALFHYSIGIPDLPLSRAFFSSVAIQRNAQHHLPIRMGVRNRRG
jgi:DNA polymerase gamma 1